MSSLFILFGAVASIFAASGSASSPNNSILLPKGGLNDIRSAIEAAQQRATFSHDDAPSASIFGVVGGGGSSSSQNKQNAASATAFSPRGGAISSSSSTRNDRSSSSPGASGSMLTKPIRIAFQGEAGAYSEKCLRELLGPNVIAVPRPNFEACYRAVASTECDYAIVPIENSLGGSIHENYDLMLRYDLTIVAEHDFRVRHCLLTKPGLDVGKIKYAISHSQALSQCDNFLRSRGIQPRPTYDTAGSAKMIIDKINGEQAREMPEGCTPENTAAIASELAGRTFGLECKQEGIEDDDSNFTRFLLLGRDGVVQHLNRKIPSKTSLVFTLPESAGALYRSLACFSMRDIDMTKIESRPMSAALLNYLRFRNTVTQHHSSRGGGRRGSSDKELPRFRYCFYLDILSSELDEGVQNALHHLREQSDYCRVLGSYPAGSRLVGPVAEAVEALHAANAGRTRSGDDGGLRLKSLPSDEEEARRLNVGFVGYGAFGQYLSKQMTSQHNVRCVDRVDKSREARENDVEYFPMFEMSSFLKGLDVVVMSVPMVELEETLDKLPLDKLRGKLVVEVCSLNAYPRTLLTRALPPEADILCTHPMFGPGMPLDGVPVVYEKVRTRDTQRADCFLSFFEQARCQMVEMSSEDHDNYVADAEFVTHLTGRLLDGNLLPVSPVSSKECAALRDVADMATGDSFEMFFGMYKYNDRAFGLLDTMRDNLAGVERKLAAKEAYLAASAEMQNTDRQKLLAECRMLLREMAKSGGADLLEDKPKKGAPQTEQNNGTTSD